MCTEKFKLNSNNTNNTQFLLRIHSKCSVIGGMCVDILASKTEHVAQRRTISTLFYLQVKR